MATFRTARAATRHAQRARGLATLRLGTILGSLALITGGTGAADQHLPHDAPRVAIYGHTVVNTWPHDAGAFTQGLAFADGKLYESTGLHGASSVRIVAMTTGSVQRRINLPVRYFGEGIAILDGRIYQLTWRNRKGFIYRQDNLKYLGEFAYEGEGWGLATDGASLIMSDGTHRLRFLNPHTFKVERTIEVYENGRPLANLNELEYIKGEIYANLWQRDEIARIEPKTGKLLGLIDLSGLSPATEADAVLNGIAYDRARDRIFVTGKLWPKLFEIRLKEK